MKTNSRHKVSNENEALATDTEAIKKDKFNKFEVMEEVDNFLKIYKLIKQTSEELVIIIEDTEKVFKELIIKTHWTR